MMKNARITKTTAHFFGKIVKCFEKMFAQLFAVKNQKMFCEKPFHVISNNNVFAAVDDNSLPSSTTEVLPVTTILGNSKVGS